MPRAFAIELALALGAAAVDSTGYVHFIRQMIAVLMSYKTTASGTLALPRCFSVLSTARTTPARKARQRMTLGDGVKR